MTMHEPGKSDKPVVPTNSAKIGYWDFYQEQVERMEGRGLAKENAEELILCPADPAKQVDRTQSRVGKGQSLPEDLHSELDRVRQAACRDKQLKFTSLWHHVYDVDRLRQAYLALKRDVSAGIDGQTWRDYGRELESNLKGLSERLAKGSYRAKPVKRVYIPKADGRQRPIGIPVLEDKIDTLDHECLMKFIGQRIADPRVLRHIQKWLNAGVLENGSYVEQEEGTPQGGSISPLLGNIYLHHVLDLWADQWRKTRAHGDMIIVRYADDFVVGFQHQSDATAFLEELRERFRAFNLELHAEKTRILEFGRFAAQRREERGLGKPETFNFLGFTHACDKTRDGRFIVLRRTMAVRMRAKLRFIKQELRKRLHEPVAQVGGWLKAVLSGYYRYFGVPRNTEALNRFRVVVYWLWRRSLGRRSQKGRLNLARYNPLAARWLPLPCVCQPYPEQRLRVMIRGKSPVR
jgi:retron-type reverse transcriptase